MMLAIYLTAPEIENDRRALNIFYGMRRARKEGRWVSSAPIGYANKTTENGTKYVAVKEPHASILRWAFTEIGKGTYFVAEVYSEARKKGLGCSKNRFYVAIRNPVYCGKVLIPKFKEEDEKVVLGLHEPIISEALFYDVQNVLNGRKRAVKTKIMSIDELPLRGFLAC